MGDNSKNINVTKKLGITFIIIIAIKIKIWTYKILNLIYTYQTLAITSLTPDPKLKKEARRASMVELLSNKKIKKNKR